METKTIKKKKQNNGADIREEHSEIHGCLGEVIIQLWHA